MKGPSVSARLGQPYSGRGSAGSWAIRSEKSGTSRQHFIVGWDNLSPIGQGAQRSARTKRMVSQRWSAKRIPGCWAIAGS